jgi:hypothetical protein
MRKENEIYCSNCGTLINLEARFCTTCGFNQVEFPILSKINDKLNKEESILNIEEPVLDYKIESEKNKVIADVKKNKVIGYIFFFILVYAIWYFTSTTSTSSANSSNISSSNSVAKECNGVGNESCISSVRQNFNNTGKTILGEQYLGDGRFGISFMDSQHPGAYNATISTDCKCNITNSNVSTIR